MLRFDVRGDLRAITQHLNRMHREQVPYATAVSLTRTAKFVQGEMAREIGRVFDRPKSYTQGATWVRPATKQNLAAEVLIKDQAFKSAPPIKWLAAEIYGGVRKHKAFELLLIRSGVMPANMYAVPTKAAPMDAYGNMQTAEINRLLSDVRARRDPLQNATAASKGRRIRSRTKAAYFYFSTYPVNSRTRHLAPGIYKRTAASGMVGPVRVGIKPVLLFVRAPRYRQRLRFHQIADQVARMRWPIEFQLAMRQALATAR